MSEVILETKFLMMKKAIIFGMVLFFAGFGLKFFHIHYNAILMMAGLFILMVSYTISAFVKNKEVNTLVGFTITSWLTFLLFTIKYFPHVTYVFYVSLALTLVVLIRTLNDKFNFQLVALSLCVFLSVSLYLMPSDERYYLLSIKWNHEIDTDYITYDKYSWFLYKHEKVEEALKISEKAKRIAMKQNDKQWEAFIANHSQQIKNRNWNAYR